MGPASDVLQCCRDRARGRSRGRIALEVFHDGDANRMAVCGRARDRPGVRGGAMRTRVPFLTRLSTWLRLFAVQGSWNYEILLGNGIGFCAEPALRLLPGGRGGDQYRRALARQSRYFNAHPYLASVAVGALTRAELEGVDPAKIERFRTALAGPLGSVGDRLVWSGWLPLCSLVGLLVYGLGGTAGAVAAVFLLTYNAGHVALRAWGLKVGFSRG